MNILWTISTIDVNASHLKFKMDLSIRKKKIVYAKYNIGVGYTD
jgi:hypothetical protein